MDVTARLDESRNEYQLGAEVDGVFVPFVSVSRAHVEGHVASVKEWQASQPATEQPAPPPPPPGGQA